MELLFIVYYLNAGNIFHRCTRSFPKGLFAATAEKLIFKYIKYEMQHEKNKWVESRCNFSFHISVLRFYLYQSSVQMRVTHTYWYEDKKSGHHSMFSSDLLIWHSFPNLSSLTEVRFSSRSGLYPNVTLSLRSSWTPLFETAPTGLMGWSPCACGSFPPFSALFFPLHVLFIY